MKLIHTGCAEINSAGPHNHTKTTTILLLTTVVCDIGVWFSALENSQHTVFLQLLACALTSTCVGQPQTQPLLSPSHPSFFTETFSLSFSLRNLKFVKFGLLHTMAGLCRHPNVRPRYRTPRNCPRKHVRDLLLNQNTGTAILELEVEDNHPDFAELKRMEESGCVFAGLLRNCIRTKLDRFIRDSTLEIGVISIRKISYLGQRNDEFHISPGSCNGLHYLVVAMDIQVRESSSIEGFITFDVFADESRR
jgi:hypothetical protein